MSKTMSVRLAPAAAPRIEVTSAKSPLVEWNPTEREGQIRSG
jgi:hypothetical protein